MSHWTRTQPVRRPSLTCFNVLKLEAMPFAELQTFSVRKKKFKESTTNVFDLQEYCAT